MLDNLPRLPKNTISIHQVQLILQGARLRGFDVPALLERAGISPDLMNQPRARVTQSQYSRLVIIMTRKLRDELWGLCSQPLPPGSFASCCRLLAHAPNLGEALRLGFRYFHPLLSDFTPRLRVDDGIAFCELQDHVKPTDAQRYAKRVFLFFSYGLACWLLEKRIPLLAVHYRQDDAQVATEAMRLFQAPVLYVNGNMGYCFSAQWLSTPVLQHEKSIESYLQRAPSSMLLTYRDQTSYTERVKKLVRKDLSDPLLSFEQVARTLNTTPQTLRRKLMAEGQGFQEIKNEMRRDVAIELLSDTDVKMSEIANRLGFSELATFHRAFREWTGTTPGKFRSGMEKIGNDTQ